MLRMMLCMLVVGTSFIANLATQSALAVTAGSLSQIKINSGQVEQAFTPRRLALLVGVRSFTDTRFRPLEFPAKDAQDIRAFLHTNNRATADEDIMLLDEQATTANILAALDDLERKNTSTDDIVIVYLSTHGTLAYEDSRRLRRYAVTSDTAFERVADTGISLDYLQSRLARLKSDRKALILALCHSGSGKSELADNLRRELQSMKSDFFPQPLHEVSSATMVLSASSWGQPAREDPSLSNDIYTHFLLQGLEKNDANGDGAVSLFEAHEFARSRTYDFTRGQQTPTALINIEGADPIILKGRVRQQSQSMIFADSERFRDVQLLINGEKKGSLWEPQRVPPGRVRLTLVDPRHPDTPLIDHSLYMRADKAYAVSTLFERPPAWGSEFRLYNLPLPAGIDGTRRRDFWAPGAAVRGSDILGTPLAAQLGYYQRQLSGVAHLSTEDISSALTISCLQLGIGASIYPTRRLSLTGGLTLERLSIDRILASPAIERSLQSASIIYPTVMLEARALQLVNQFYAGVSASFLPMRRSGIEIDGETHSLASATGAGFIGFSF